MAGAKPTSKADMDPNFEKHLRGLKDHAKDQEYENRRKGNQVKWYRPVGWNGDPFDYAGLHTPFDRKKANENLLDAIKDGNEPGTTGDVVACSVMIGVLAVQERAFRVRHTLRRCRATAHTLGRAKGQGDDKGPFVQLGIEYVRGILKQAKKT